MADEQPTPGRFVRADLRTTDPEGAKRFYLALFPDWQIERIETGADGPYDRVSVAGRGSFAIAPLDPAQGPPARWFVYVTVPDVDQACAAAASLGGEVVAAPSDLPGVGRRAVVADPEGAVFAPVCLTDEPPEHEGPMPEGAFCWHELLARRPVEAAAFYTSLLGWSHAEVPTPMGAYHLFRRGDRDAAGLMPMPAEAKGPPMWLVYLYAADIEATAAKLKELGGTVHRPVTAMPGIGQLAVVADPQGAVFCLFRSERG